MNIKFLVTLLFCTTLIRSAAFATILNVNNNANSPGQYTDITAAITSAVAGDTILVAGSPTNYGDFTITKKLTLLGTGYYPRKDVQLISTVGQITVIGGAADNSVIQGFNFYGLNSSGINGLEISRCYLTGIGYGYSIYLTGATNTTFYQNIFGAYVSFQDCSNITLTNNIFNGYLNIPGPNSTTNVVVKNNIFLGDNVAFTYGTIFSNNIFYYRSTLVNTLDPFSTSANNVYNNNIYYNQKPNPIPIGMNSNTGTGNLMANPLFKSINLSGTFESIIYFEDYRLQAGSPAINFGTDGMDAGVYGGFVAIDYPLAGEALVPQVKTMTISNNVVSPGGTLRVNVKVKKAN